MPANAATGQHDLPNDSAPSAPIKSLPVAAASRDRGDTLRQQGSKAGSALGVRSKIISVADQLP